MWFLVREHGIDCMSFEQNNKFAFLPRKYHIYQTTGRQVKPET